MSKRLRTIRFNIWIFCIGAIFFSAAAVIAGETKDMGGWEKGGPYNDFYNVVELDSFKAKIVKITEAAPMPGMTPGVILKVKESEEVAFDV